MKKSSGLLLLFFLLLVFIKNTNAQKEFDGIRGTKHWPMFTDASNSLYHYIAGQAYEDLNKRSQKVAAIHTLDEWKQRQQWIRKTLNESVGAFPEKTPLNARITKSYQEDGYRLEDIIYESQPGYNVTAAMFIPDQLKKGEKAPAVIYCSGHSDNGYRAKVYQRTILNLVKKGFIVFAFDPMGQGERLQYYNPQTGKSMFPWPSYEHSYAGAQLFLEGNTLANYFIWDGIRAIDYLISRKEVDPNRIGITGRSGGGTQSAFIAAFDNRIKAVGSGNYYTNLTRLFQAMGPQDAEQNFFYGIARGLDMGDLLAVRAPKPELMITTSRDMFPIQGAIETRKEVMPVYEAYGKPANLQMVMDDAPHASTKKNREAMYAFFQRTLDNPGDSTDKDVKMIADEHLQVTKTGQVSTSLNGESAFSLNKKDAEKKMPSLEKKRKDLPGYFPGIISSAKKLSGYQAPKRTEQPTFAGRIQRDGYVIEKHLVKGEGKYLIPYLLFRPDVANGKGLIYLNPEGKVIDSDKGGRIEWFVKNGLTVLVPDIIGTGELGPGSFQGDSYIDSVSYNLWFASMLVGRSIVGIQAADVVRLADILKNEYHQKEIYGFAKKQMAPVLLHAAAFDKDISKVALIQPYSSYRSIVMNRLYDPHFIQSTVPASIGVYDLPDLAASLAPQKLVMVGVTDGTGSDQNSEDINRDLSVIKAAYDFKNANNKLQIAPALSQKNLDNILKSWIE
jgi:cephalosporin-C deacetylase-like acetyl esterase